MRVEKCIATLLGLLFLATTMPLSAVAADNGNSRVEYIEEKHVFRNSNELTVLNLSLEWPVKLKGQCLNTLQRDLCLRLFQNQGQTFYEGCKLLFQQLGTEVDAIPDEKGLQVKYRSIILRMVSWEPGRFLSVYLVVTARDRDKSECSEVRQQLLTYDIPNDKVLMPRELLKRSCYPGHVDNDSFLDVIQRFMPKVEYVVEGDSLPEWVCLLSRKQGGLFNLKGSNGSNNIDDLMVVPYNFFKYFLTSQAIELMERDMKVPKKKREKIKAESMRLDAIVQKQYERPGVYQVVDTMPRFQGGNDELAHYFSQNLVYPEDEKTSPVAGKVVVSFIVNEDGYVSDPAVIMPVSPGLDREAVRVVRAMPRWEPGRLDGVPVKVRMQIPVRFTYE